MRKILDYIVENSGGKYHCYKSNKVNLDKTESDILTYDDKPAKSQNSSKFAETDALRVNTVCIDKQLIGSSRPIFTLFLDGSRHVYKIDDIAIGKKIFPVLAGQIIVGCCERKDRDSFKPFNKIHPKIVMALPDDFDVDDEGENFCRLWCEKINENLSESRIPTSLGLNINKILLYKTDKKDKYNSDKDNYKNRGTAKIQAEMTDEEQELVAELCRQNKLDDEHYLIKDGSLEYNPSFSNNSKENSALLRENYKYVVGVSKSFDPELLPDFQGHKLSKTIASLNPYERTKAYKYISDANGVQYAVWYLRLRNSDFRETHFSDVVKCEMVMINEEEQISSDLINVISANLIKEAYPVCYGKDLRWGNHLYPVFLTESYCKSKYYSPEILLNIF